MQRELKRGVLNQSALSLATESSRKDLLPCLIKQHKNSKLLRASRRKFHLFYNLLTVLRAAKNEHFVARGMRTHTHFASKQTQNFAAVTRATPFLVLNIRTMSSGFAML